MIDCGSLDYAQARLNARHGERLRESDWRRLEGVRAFAALLDTARATALRPWLVGIVADSTSHQAESALRRHWREVVDEVAGWMPAPWRPAVAWWRTLVDLAPLQHLARGGEPPAWMRDDTEWRAASESPSHPPSTVAAAGPFAPLAFAAADPDALGAAWLDEWRRRWPAIGDETQRELATVVNVLTDHRRAFGAASGGAGWPLRQALRDQLRLRLRAATLSPAAAFVHLVLCALDLERLRAELLRRLAFPRWDAA